MDEAWAQDVDEAMRAGDRARLSALYQAAVDALGAHEASQAWLTVVSALDASAITG